MTRPQLSKHLEAAVLVQSRRRCCICYGLKRDAGTKRGQIAHLDRNRENNVPDNLVFLCFDHHDEYDSRTSQSKGLTATEVRVYRAELEDALAAALRAPLTLNESPVDDGAWPGLYRWVHSNSSAELEIVPDESGGVRARGIAFWGTTNRYGPHLGELDVVAVRDGTALRIEQDGYVLLLKRIVGGLVVAEQRAEIGIFGMNVTFDGTYARVPFGAGALPQAQLRPFESEFWPSEGRPVFKAVSDVLDLRARPANDAPRMPGLRVTMGSTIAFRGFRYRTVRPGTILVTKDTTIEGRSLGQTEYISQANYYQDGGENVSIGLKEGSELEYLQYRAEGSGFVRWQGLVLEITQLPWLADPEAFALVTSPVAEAWVQINDTAGYSGWVLANGQLEIATREF